MAEQLKWETHHGQEILINDYSDQHADELLQTLLENTKAIRELKQDELRLLVIVRGVMANKELVGTWKKVAAEDKHIYKKVAVVGITGLLSTFLWAINTFSGIGAKPFDEEAEAFEWLASE